MEHMIAICKVGSMSVTLHCLTSRIVLCVLFSLVHVHIFIAGSVTISAAMLHF